MKLDYCRDTPQASSWHESPHQEPLPVEPYDIHMPLKRVTLILGKRETTREAAYYGVAHTAMGECVKE